MNIHFNKYNNFQRMWDVISLLRPVTLENHCHDTFFLGCPLYPADTVILMNNLNRIVNVEEIAIDLLTRGKSDFSLEDSDLVFKYQFDFFRTSDRLLVVYVISVCLHIVVHTF